MQFQYLPTIDTMKTTPEMVGSMAKPAARVKKNPTEKSAAEWATEMAELRKIKPRTLSQLYGAKGPTPEQAAAWSDKMHDWNSRYRKASAEQKKALARDNARFRNPLVKTVVKTKDRDVRSFAFHVQEWVGAAKFAKGDWYSIAGFDLRPDAVAFARAKAAKSPAVAYRVIDQN